MRALTSFAFSLLPLHRVELYIEPDNHASRRAAERAGYLLEGTLRQHQEIGGVRRDMCLFAALRDRAPWAPATSQSTGARAHE